MRSRPLYAVSEEVIASGKNGDHRVEIIDVVYLECHEKRNGDIYSGWCYLLSNSKSGRDYATEPLLRKLPPEERTDWSDCEWQPNKVTVEA